MKMLGTPARTPSPCRDSNSSLIGRAGPSTSLAGSRSSTRGSEVTGILLATAEFGRFAHVDRDLSDGVWELREEFRFEDDGHHLRGRRGLQNDHRIAIASVVEGL